MDILFKAHKELLILLLESNVDYMLIGGYSVIYYGYNRGTNDMDLWLMPDNQNKLKLLQALKKFGINPADLKKLEALDFTETRMFFIGEAPDKIDFLTKVQNVVWEEAIRNVNYFEYEGHLIPIVDFEDLILMKMASNRLKDKADVEELQKIRKFRKKGE